MKALSVRQPWAWAIVHAGKRIENRERADGGKPSLCDYRGPLLIHASKACTRTEYDGACEALEYLDLPMPPALSDLTTLRRGGIIGRCRVVAHVEPTGAVRELPDLESGAPNIGDLDMRWWSTHSYGIVLADVEPVPFFPWKGMLGIFDGPSAEIIDATIRAGAVHT